MQMCSELLLNLNLCHINTQPFHLAFASYVFILHSHPPFGSYEILLQQWSSPSVLA